MNKEQINEVKTQLWEHLRFIRGQIEKLSKEGRMEHRSEYVIDRYGGFRRYGNWLLDQHYFCQSEIEYWKELAG